jgi:predicted Zn-dependent protease
MRALRPWTLVTATVLGLFSLGCAKNPVTGRMELSLINEQEEIALGQQSRPEVLQEFDGSVPEPRLQAYVTEVGQKLAAVGERPNLPYSYEVLNSSDVNAFALPGGKVFVTRGLITRLSNEAQLAGVLGHETGHVTAKHAVRSLSSALALQIPLLVGATYAELHGRGQYLVAVGALSAGLLQLRFSRHHESEADRLGIQYSARAGYNPEGMVQLLEILKESQVREPSKFENLFNTHPLTGERIETAKTIVAHDFPNLDSLNLAWNPERFADALAQLRSEQRAYDEFDLAEAARNEGRTADALQLYGDAIAQAPNEPLFYIGRGLAYRSGGQLDAARADLHKGASMSSDLWIGQYALGLAEFEAGNADVAAEALTSATRLVPADPSPYLYLGQIAEGRGDGTSASDYYSIAGELAKASSKDDVYGAAMQGLGRVGH